MQNKLDDNINDSYRSGMSIVDKFNIKYLNELVEKRNFINRFSHNAKVGDIVRILNQKIQETEISLSRGGYEEINKQDDD